ncbi:unannotated protein [freshwater metagenome]|uniref:Unannotated protein n=1 Tax=freshwater metagenome TaxID=449393 RepID=A0A6J6ZVD9_9ZZZZ
MICRRAAVFLSGALLLAACGSGTPSVGPTSAPPSTSGREAPPTAESAANGPCGRAAPLAPPRIGEIRSAVERLRGGAGAAQYSEVNATPSEINVFVVRDGKEFAYVVCTDSVSEPTDGGQDYRGPTFTDSDIEFAPTVLDKVLGSIKDSHVVAFSITPRDGGGVEYIATLTAPSGEFRVLLDADGGVLATG